MLFVTYTGHLAGHYAWISLLPCQTLRNISIMLMHPNQTEVFGGTTDRVCLRLSNIAVFKSIFPFQRPILFVQNFMRNPFLRKKKNLKPFQKPLEDAGRDILTLHSRREIELMKNYMAQGILEVWEVVTILHSF